MFGCGGTCGLIYAEILSCSKKSKNLTTPFWIKFFKKFPLLVHSAAFELPDPDSEDEEISEALVNALKLAHSSNPAERSTLGAERHMASSG